jgi:hypothetical protein
VQAPQPRRPERQRSGLDPARRRSLLVYGGAAAGVAALVAVVVVLVATGGSSSAGNASAIRSTLAAAGCTMSTSTAARYGQHISDFKTTVAYKTFPPVSGRHYQVPAIWGDYRQAVDPRQAVHNEEHGGVIIWYGPTITARDRQSISDFVDSSPNAMLVTPLADSSPGVKYPPHQPLGSKIALSAWTVTFKNGQIGDGTNVIAVCPHFSDKAFTSFRNQFRGKGPERFPVDTLTPGT